jgi:hypothetical protein
MTSWHKIGIHATTILALSLMSLPPYAKSENNITIIHPEPGLYLEELGEIDLKRGQIRLNFAINRTDIETDIKNANQTIQNFDAACTETRRSTEDRHCQR